MDETLRIINEIVAEKTANRRYPIHALTREVISRRPEAKEELEQMELDGVIRIKRTINSDYIEIV